MSTTPSNKKQANLLRSAASALDHGRYSTAMKKLQAAIGGCERLLDSTGLPPLPEVIGCEATNLNRAQWALRAVTQFAKDTGLSTDLSVGEMPTAVGDLLCDIMHLCDSGLIGKEINFHERLSAATGHYGEETALELVCSECNEINYVKDEKEAKVKPCDDCGAVGKLITFAEADVPGATRADRDPMQLLDTQIMRRSMR